MGQSIAQSLYGSATDCAVSTMEVVKISPKYQVVIPKDVREALGLRPGQKVMVMAYAGRAQIVPVEEPEDTSRHRGRHRHHR